MILKVMDSHVLSCDTCKMSVTRPFQSWDHALDYAKQKGWKVLIDQKGHGFKHVCPNCQEGTCEGLHSIGTEEDSKMGDHLKGCVVENGILKACKLLKRVLHPEPNAQCKGAYLLELRNTKTGEVTRTGAVIRSGEYSKGGVLMNFCPFCGHDISAHFRGE